MTDYRTTRLDAVNRILSTIGEQKVNALAPATPSVQIAEDLLDDEWRMVLDLGWWWNTEDDHEVVPNASGEFHVPSNWIRIEPKDRRYSPKRLIIRDAKVWDLYNRTFLIGSSKLIVDAVLWLDWDEIIESGKAYITARAARRYAAASGDSTQVRAAELAQVEAEQAMKKHGRAKARFNALHSRHALRVLGRAGGAAWPVRDTITSV